MIQVLSLRGRGGVRPCGEYVGRPSALGNPFLVGRDGTREDVIGALSALVESAVEAAVGRCGRSWSDWPRSTGAMGS